MIMKGRNVFEILWIFAIFQVLQVHLVDSQDVCRSFTCYNGGTCILGLNGQPMCVCPPSYKPPQCGFDPCVGVSCGYGTCTNVQDAAFCRCDEGYTGTTCAIPSNPCVGFICGYGTCKTIRDAAVCECNPGYSGNICMTPVNNPCVGVNCGYGTCRKIQDAAVCQCKQGYTGTLCTIPVANPCNLAVCEFGTCRVGGQGQAICDCARGYSGPTCATPDKRAICSYKCENGWCDDLGRCDCDPGYTGKDCNVKSAVSTLSQNQPQIWPTKGPKAGGTTLNLQHPGFTQDCYDVRFAASKSGGQAITTCEACRPSPNAKVRICTTKALNTYLDKPLYLTIVLNGQVMTDLVIQGTFTYKTNPVLKKIYPLDTIVAGGTLLTVEGTNIDSVAEPSMETVLKVGNIENLFDTTCTVISSTKMHCSTPAFELLREYSPTAQGKKVPTKRSVSDRDPLEKLFRHKRQTTVLQGNTALTSRPDISATITKITLDGFKKYWNVKKELAAYHQLAVYVNPALIPFEEAKWVHRPFWPHKDTHITIKGKDMQIGKTPELLFTVNIGQGVCSELDVSATSMTCKPPKSEPQPTEREQDLHAWVMIGNLAFDLGKVHYWKGSLPGKGSFFDSMIVKIILASAIGGLLLIIIIIFTTIYCCKRRKPSNTRPKHNPEEDYYHSYSREIPT